MSGKGGDQENEIEVKRKMKKINEEVLFLKIHSDRLFGPVFSLKITNDIKFLNKERNLLERFKELTR